MEVKQVKGLMEAYASVYSNIFESHFKVGDEVICKASGMEGEVIKVDPEEKGKYYTVKHEDGKTMKYAPDELKLEKEEKEDKKEDVKEAKHSGASKKSETKFHTKLDKLVHKTFGASPEEKKMKKEEVETDLFDYLLEYLVAEGYAETNEAALAIMANMSEEWRESIVEKYSTFGYDAEDPGNDFEQFLEKGPKTNKQKRNAIELNKKILSKPGMPIKGV